MSETNKPLVSVKNMTVNFRVGRGILTAVNDVSFDIYKGETFALVGESGSGKTTIGRTIIRLNPIAGGSVEYNNEVISGKIPKAKDKEIISKLQMIFQDPMASLNERAKVSYIVSEGILSTRPDIGGDERAKMVDEALMEVGLLPEFASRFPHEFSGGQRQRIGVARALIMKPDFIIADEPISALDVSIRAQILNLLNKLKKDRGLTYLFIAHDLSVVRFFSDRIGVIHKGRLVEMADSVELFKRPLHPYTKALLSAVPVPDPKVAKVKEHTVYDPNQHDYREDKPSFHQILPGHFVFGNEAELEGYKKFV
ncbi:MAG: ABC transporter ATP-binding protein [Clostridiales bacterium]|jgi:oligopeptide transport system ATP-binding protein|nr:ABC transporter ATP-binding protein [Clostridiales bacterium]